MTTRRPRSLIVWVAQGFGAGRIPVAPGTFGSVVGVGWLLLLLLPRNSWFFSSMVILTAFGSVWICGIVEKLLNQTDPPSVVLDEIIAVPFCFAGWIGLYYARNGSMPSPDYFFQGTTWPLTLAVVLAFRIFDVWKPWPIRQSQRLSGGWGVTIDDLLAALYVNLVTMIVFAFPGVVEKIVPLN